MKRGSILVGIACIACVAAAPPAVARAESGVDVGLDGGRDAGDGGAAADMDAALATDGAISMDASSGDAGDGSGLDVGSDAPGCGAAPGMICNGLCHPPFRCDDPACTSQCNHTCYECTGRTWRAVVTDCFCHDDASVIDATRGDSGTGPSPVGSCACRASAGGLSSVSLVIVVLVLGVARAGRRRDRERSKRR